MTRCDRGAEEAELEAFFGVADFQMDENSEINIF